MATKVISSNCVSVSDYERLLKTVEELDSHVQEVDDSLVTFTSEHYVFHEEEKTKYNEELDIIRRDIHKLRVALTWAVAGLLCSGIAILALCIHLIS